MDPKLYLVLIYLYLIIFTIMIIIVNNTSKKGNNDFFRINLSNLNEHEYKKCEYL